MILKVGLERLSAAHVRLESCEGRKMTMASSYVPYGRVASQAGWCEASWQNWVDLWSRPGMGVLGQLSSAVVRYDTWPFPS